MALLKSKACQDVVDAEAKLRACAIDAAHQFGAWCGKYGFDALPVTHEVVGAHLIAIARTCSVVGHPLCIKHPAVRRPLCRNGCKQASPARRR
jgi:hypothetical protein